MKRSVDYDELLRDAVAGDAKEFWSPDKPWRTTFRREQVLELMSHIKKMCREEVSKAEKADILREWAPKAIEEERSLKGALAVAIMRNLDRMRVCANPECQQPFVAGRPSQKYCDKAECKVAAQHGYMRTYYRRTLKARRAKRETNRA